MFGLLNPYFKIIVSTGEKLIKNFLILVSGFTDFVRFHG